MQQSQPLPIQLRRLAQDDAAAWREIRLEALQSTPSAFGSSYEEESVKDVAAFAEQIPPANFPNVIVGAFLDNQLIGNAGLFINQAIKLRHKGTLFGVFVRPEFRGRKIGQQLVREVLRYAAEQVEVVQASVVIENIAARQLYYDLGFRPFGFEAQALKIGDRYYDEEHIALNLRSA
jgi:RimJ/RimL family protein N-acetyltransferase